MLEHEVDTLAYRSPLAQDPVLRDVISLFVEEIPSHVARMREYFQECQWHALRLATRRLSASVASHGFDQLLPHCAELEGKLSRRLPTDQVEAALDSLAAQCCRLTASP
jgi:HPt (histidine-containing phosphotransfer) domain-containing protein